jgi:hypothetical protein
VNDKHFGFGVALRFLRMSEKLKRQGWGDRVLFMREGIIMDRSNRYDILIPAQADIPASDWRVVK